ncbi:ATP-binding protein [Streptomyces sp. NPDC001820]|uniref:ATP-binding protein n=1 Tax=Streptomyces sp. NPDC001820 TaxID=3364613 RepID=UPI0036BD62FB
MTTHLSASLSTSTGRGGRFCGAEPGAEPLPGLPRSGEPEWGLVQGNSPVGFAACGLDGQLRNAPQARHFVAATLSGWALESLVPDAAVVVSELVTNAVQHALDPASPDDGDYPVWLGIFLHPGDLVCAVTDPSSDPPRPRDADASAVGGRGLKLISALSETWSWSLTLPRGKTVWATLPLCPRAT